MTRLVFAVGLALLACGGESADWSDLPAAVAGGGAKPSAAGSAGSAGALATVGGSEATAGHASGGSAGKPPTSTDGGSIQMAGTGGAETGAAGSDGMGGSAVGGGSGGAAAAGSSQGGSGQAGQGGNPSGGKGGEPEQTTCNGDDVMDCNGLPNDGLNQINPDDCEAWKGDHDTCGSCEKKCGVTQVCKIYGSPGAWNYGCVSP